MDKEKNNQETPSESEPCSEELQSSEQEGSEGKGFPIVGLGASAGGLEAMKTFFSHVSEKSNMAYIVQIHQSPKQPSILPELLQKTTMLPVEQARDGETIQPGHVYVVPSNKEISFYKGAIQLLNPVNKSISLPIDFFFSSLAADQGRLSAAIILSGTGSDGSIGLKEVKAAEGIVLVQSEHTAKYDGMPKSAINTGLVDMVLDPQEMPEKLMHYFHSPPRHKAKETPSEEQDWLHKIFALFRVQTGHDFSAYKKNTLLRRIDRRMVLNQIQEHDVYVRFLREDPRELDALFRELLIGVTNFFREPESFEALKTEALPHILDPMEEGAVFRAWIPGCSTGEEVYSLLMILTEYLESRPKRINLQLFGTDIDKNAIEKAREGVYPASIKANVSQKRLNRFFHQEGDAYRIRKEIRDCVVFSVQDVLNDPPFSRLHLLLCRNLLIYLNSEAQKRLLPLFHYTLLPEGLLMLGSSETIGGHTNLFETLDGTWKIYKRRETPHSLRPLVKFPTGTPSDISPAASKKESTPNTGEDLGTLINKALVQHFSPPAVLVDDKGNILHIQGRTGKYLEPASGAPSRNILDMAREGLRIELSSAMRKALSSKQNVVRKKIRIKVDGGEQFINLYVNQLESPAELSGRLLVAFEDLPEAPEDDKLQEKTDPDAGIDPVEYDLKKHKERIRELEQELQSTRENHQTIVEELESSNEELKSTNEELQSSNEELQSTNEELESSKEELQSLNEELQTVNSELQSKVQELSAARDDINNLLNNTEIATVFVDNELRIKRFSQEATQIINLIESDVGRPLEHQVAKLEYGGMIQDLRQVLNNLYPVEKDVRTLDGTWYTMRIMPYRTMDNRIQGAVLTFRNVDTLKKGQEELEKLNLELQQAWLLVRDVFDMNPSPLAVLDENGTLVIANSAFTSLMNLEQEEILDMNVFNLAGGILQNSDLQENLEAALNRGENFETREFEIPSPQGTRRMTLQGRIMRQEQDQPYRILIKFIQK
ncbi:MAG: CheR family methyltransferase [Thermodesulfobacteriota bacterium]